MATPVPKPMIIIVPGNGGSGDLLELRSSNFYGWAEKSFLSRGYDVKLQPMPDPLNAKESIWCPFIVKTLMEHNTENCVLIGHSSGAAAALRIAERHKLRGLVLVAAYDSDLGDALEKASGYFSRPFKWDVIKQNCGFILQFAGEKDDLVPVAVQRKVSASLKPKVDYREHPDGDHFFEPCVRRSCCGLFISCF